MDKDNKIEKDKTPDDVVLKINNLRKDYKMFDRKRYRFQEALFPWLNKHTTFTALKDFNLELRKGEVLGILGRNGAGKSTLLKIVTGVVTPTSGTMKSKGRVSSLLELGAAFNPELTGMENIYQHGQVMGLTKEQIEKSKQKIIDFADIGDHLSQPVKTYSSGMFARLAFACAINVDPDILIVDEVLSVGDMAFQLKCFKKFEEFKKSGKTILFVTHNVTDVLKNCTRAIILKNGEKVYDGNVKDGVEKYKKMIVNLDKEDKKYSEKEVETKKPINENNSNNLWKSKQNINPKMIEYGDKRAEVVDFGIFDENGKIITAIDNDNIITMKSKVEFYENVENPIFTMTIKDFHGNDITGTNTYFEKVDTGTFNKGEIGICEFTQKLPISPGKYTVSFSCTEIDKDGNFKVLSRKYDALLIEITSKKNCVGTYMLSSDINVNKYR